MTYVKIRFISAERGATAGLVIPYDHLRTKSVQALSALYPMGEALNMRTFERSPVFDSWDKAFAYQFED